MARELLPNPNPCLAVSKNPKSCSGTWTVGVGIPEPKARNGESRGDFLDCLKSTPDRLEDSILRPCALVDVLNTNFGYLDQVFLNTNLPLSVWCLIGALDNFLFGVLARSPVLLFAFFIINLFRRDKGDFWAVFLAVLFSCLRAPWWDYA